MLRLGVFKLGVVSLGGDIPQFIPHDVVRLGVFKEKGQLFYPHIVLI